MIDGIATIVSLVGMVSLFKIFSNRGMNAMSSDGSLLATKPDENIFIFELIMSPIFLVGGSIGSLIAQNLIPLLSLVPMAVVWYLVIHHELIRRPVRIHIDGDVRLEFRTRPPMSIPFETVEWIDSSPGDPKTRAGRINRGGKMKIKGRKYPIPLGYEAAEAVRRAYAGKQGKYPPLHPRLAGTYNMSRE